MKEDYVRQNPIMEGPNLGMSSFTSDVVSNPVRVIKTVKQTGDVNATCATLAQLQAMRSRILRPLHATAELHAMCQDVA